MIVSTTPTIEGRPVREYLGFVTGETILGADALFGVDPDYESISFGGGGGMLMVTASGTAVKL